MTAWAATAVLAALLPLAACGSDDGGYVLHYSTYSSSTSDQTETVHRWAKEVDEKSGGEITVQFHYSGSLIGADESLQATLDERVDMAHVGSIYVASDLSMYTVSELPFQASGPEELMRAVHRMYDENEEYRDDFERNNVRQMFPLPLGNASIGLKQKAETPADVRGRSIRSGGLISEVLLKTGANPVSMVATDVYESMERGIISGYTSFALSNLTAFGVDRSTPFVLDPGIGGFGSSVVVMNQDVYESMPEDLQEIIDTASGNAITDGLEEVIRHACEVVKASGGEVYRFSDEDIEAWKTQVNLDEEWIARYEDRGYDARGVMTQFREILDEEAAAASYVDPLQTCMEADENTTDTTDDNRLLPLGDRRDTSPCHHLPDGR